jgi:hypothetical protein
MSVAEFSGLVILIGAVWYWFHAIRAKEVARLAGRRRCNEVGVIFLDDTVMLTRLRLRRDGMGRMKIYREFQFEFASDGGVRYGGEIALLGERVVSLVMEPYRELH